MICQKPENRFYFSIIHHKIGFNEVRPSEQRAGEVGLHPLGYILLSYDYNMKEKKKIFIATTNKSKLRPFTMAWKKLGLDKCYHLVNLAELELLGDIKIKEDTGSFEGDALKKAEGYSRIINLPTIAIDRGIEFEALDGWPGTKTKEVFSGSDETIFNFEALKLNLTGNELDIKRSQAILNKIKDKDRGVKSVYGIAVVFPSGEKASELVTVEGKAAHKLKITSTGYFYDWFFVPKGYNKTLSEFSEHNYLEFVSETLWPIPDRIRKFLMERY